MDETSFIELAHAQERSPEDGGIGARPRSREYYLDVAPGKRASFLKLRAKNSKYRKNHKIKTAGAAGAAAEPEPGPGEFPAGFAIPNPDDMDEKDEGEPLPPPEDAPPNVPEGPAEPPPTLLARARSGAMTIARRAVGAGDGNEADLEQRRARLRLMIARDGSGERFAEAMKRLKAVKIDHLDAAGVALAEEALALVNYGKWGQDAAHKATTASTELVLRVAEKRGVKPRTSREVVHEAVQADVSLHEDLAASLSSVILLLPTPVRVGLSFAADLVVGFNR